MTNVMACFNKLLNPFIVLKNCAEFRGRGFKESDVYTIDPDGKGKFEVIICFLLLWWSLAVLDQAMPFSARLSSPWQRSKILVEFLGDILFI